MIVKAEDAEKNRFTMNPGFVFPQCNTCLNLNRTKKPEWPTCKAFPDGIPEEILDGYHDHTEAYPGDNGVRYEPEAGSREQGKFEQPPTDQPAEPKFEPYKGKIRKPGTGCVTMINDHLYEGRFSPRLNGKRISKNIYAATREECEEKLKVLIAEMKKEIEEIRANARNDGQFT